MNAHTQRFVASLKQAERILRAMGDRAEKWHGHQMEKINRESEGMDAATVAARVLAQTGAYEQRVSELIDLEMCLREAVTAVNEANRQMERKAQQANMAISYRAARYPETVNRTHHDRETVRSGSLLYAIETQPDLY